MSGESCQYLACWFPSPLFQQVVSSHCIGYVWYTSTCLSRSSLGRRIWKRCTSYVLVSYILCLSMCLSWGQFSKSSFMEYMGLYVFHLPISVIIDCGNTCTLCYYQHQIGSMTVCHCLGLGHETMACGVYLSIFLGKITCFISVSGYGRQCFILP